MKLIVGLPHLSHGALLKTLCGLKAPAMVSASCLARWETIEWKGDRTRQWKSWNTKPLDRAINSGLEIHLDSAGFVAMALRGGYDWSPQSYVSTLVAHPAVYRASSMDLCVEREVAADRMAVEERIAKTINLNHRCHEVAQDEGVCEKLMPVIQGDTAEDYLRCFEGISSIVPSNSVIGVGSMCRRPTNGATGAIAIIAHLHNQLPKDVTLHLFGVKSDAAEAMQMFDGRVSSVDSQAYGTRARMLAGEHRKTDPSFSKTDVFVAGVMSDWYHKQSNRLSSPREFCLQQTMDLQEPDQPQTVLQAVEIQMRREFADLISEGALDHDQYIGGRMLEEAVMERLSSLPATIRASDPFSGDWSALEFSEF